MSRFLGFESYLIPIGSSRTDVHNTIKAALVSKGWQIVRDSLQAEAEAIVTNIVTADACSNAFGSPWVDDSTPANQSGLTNGIERA